VLQGHTGSVLCLQYDENVIISGSSDATVRFELTPLFLCCKSFTSLFLILVCLYSEMKTAKLYLVQM